MTWACNVDGCMELAGLRPRGRKDILQRWQHWQCSDEKRRMREEQVFETKSGRESLGRGGLVILEDLEEDARTVRRCEQKKKKSGRSAGSVSPRHKTLVDKLWRKKELRSCEDGVPREKSQDWHVMPST